MKHKLFFCIAVFGIYYCSSCSRFLDIVPDRSLAVLTEIDQYKQLLSSTSLYQTLPLIQEYGCDDFTLTNERWEISDIRTRNSYIWQADIYEGNNGTGITQDWNVPYKTLYLCNVVLDGLKALERAGNEPLHADVRAHALFFRAYQHYVLQEIYGQPFRPTSADVDLGIPLKLTSDVEESIVRATVAEVYDRILTDLRMAIPLASSTAPAQNKFWVCKAAIYAFLSRVTLTMQDYNASRAYADSCLSIYDKLLDYNTLSPGFSFPFPDNEEVLFVTRINSTGGLFRTSGTYADTVLYGLYGEKDLRLKTFFRWDTSVLKPVFNSFYSGNTHLFNGLALDEVYLNRAECRARLGDVSGALSDLNRLRLHRYQAGYHVPFTLSNTPNVLESVLLERRKELVLRGTRWSDLRRLNQDDRFAVSLRRVLEGVEYILLPNDPRYTYPLPPLEITMNNLPQNPR